MNRAYARRERAETAGVTGTVGVHRLLLVIEPRAAAVDADVESGPAERRRHDDRRLDRHARGKIGGNGRRNDVGRAENRQRRHRRKQNGSCTAFETPQPRFQLNANILKSQRKSCCRIATADNYRSAQKICTAGRQIKNLLAISAYYEARALPASAASRERSSLPPSVIGSACDHRKMRGREGAAERLRAVAAQRILIDLRARHHRRPQLRHAEPVRMREGGGVRDSLVRHQHAFDQLRRAPCRRRNSTARARGRG